MIRQLFKLLLSLVLVGGIHISSSGDFRFGESLSAQSKKKKKSEENDPATFGEIDALKNLKEQMKGND